MSSYCRESLGIVELHTLHVSGRTPLLKRASSWGSLERLKGQDWALQLKASASGPLLQESWFQNLPLNLIIYFWNNLIVSL